MAEHESHRTMAAVSVPWTLKKEIDMFTLADLKDIAVQIEQNGADTYRNASRRIGDPEISRITALMAEEEMRHLKWFECLDIGSTTPSDHPEIEAMGRRLLQEMMENRTFSLASGPLEDAKDIYELLSQSLSFEEDTILFYNTLGAFIENDDTKAQLEAIIGEEQRHAQKINEMMASVEDKR